MAFSFGFHNSLNGDRKYDAIQISKIFNGIINDGIFMSIGTSMMIEAGSGMMVTAGIGRAWFDSTWSLNDAEFPIIIDQSEVLQDRIDTVVLDVDSTVSVRANSIMVVKGTPSSEPVRPTLIRELTHNQYPLADILVHRNVTEITQADITNRVGMGDTPFVTGILETIDIEALVMQWEAQWTVWFSTETTNASEEMIAWTTESRAEFDAWFQGAKDTLTEDAAGALYALIMDIPIINIITTTATIGTTWEGTEAPYTQTVTVPGILPTDSVDITPNYTDDIELRRLQRAAWNLVSFASPVTDGIAFICDDGIPATDIPISIRVVR